MGLSRIEYLRDKLTQMGHPPANRIAWEKELEELEKKALPVIHTAEQIKRAASREAPPVKRDVKRKKNKFVHHWNRTLMAGSKEYIRAGGPNEKRFPWMPEGYLLDVSGYVVPPYLAQAYWCFRHGKPVFGRVWLNPKREHSDPRNAHWSSKPSKKDVKGVKHLATLLDQHREEFFRLCPVVPFYEARNRFSRSVLNGKANTDDKQRIKKEAKEKQEKEARATQIRKAQRRRQAYERSLLTGAPAEIKGLNIEAMAALRARFECGL